MFLTANVGASPGGVPGDGSTTNPTQESEQGAEGAVSARRPTEDVSRRKQSANPFEIGLHRLPQHTESDSGASPSFASSFRTDPSFLPASARRKSGRATRRRTTASHALCIGKRIPEFFARSMRPGKAGKLERICGPRACHIRDWEMDSCVPDLQILGRGHPTPTQPVTKR